MPKLPQPHTEYEFLLTAPVYYEDTTRVKGSRVVINSNLMREERFYGYTFRTDRLLRDHVFCKGFTPELLQKTSIEMRDLTVPRFNDRPDSSVVQSFFSYNVAAHGYGEVCRCSENMYLLDLTEYGGIIRRLKHLNDRLKGVPLVPAELFTVETAHPIPGSMVVGRLKPIPEHSYNHPRRLTLQANPLYTGGVGGVQEVVNLFNKGDDWVIIKAPRFTMNSP